MAQTFLYIYIFVRFHHLPDAKLFIPLQFRTQYELICIQPIRDRACQYRTHLHTANPPRVIQP